MRLDRNPVHRSIIVPWYDSAMVCYGVVFLMVWVLSFAIVGIYVAQESTPYGEFIWLPFMLTALSLAVTVSILVRLMRRYL
jgi:hypothetical protein